MHVYSTAAVELLISTPTDATIHVTSLAHALDGLTLSSRSNSWTELTSDNSIRLLQLQPAVANEDPLHGTLVEIQLTEPSRTSEVVEEPDNIAVGSEDSRRRVGGRGRVEPSLPTSGRADTAL